MNLNSSDIVIQCYPEQAEKDFWFEAKRTGTFARESQCFMAVNASPFEKKNFISTKRRTVGIHRSQKINLSSPEEKYSAITFSKKDTGYSASIIKNQNEIEIEKSDYAFGGFFTIVQNGKYVDEYKKIKDARLAIGIKDNSRTLVFLAAEKLTFEEYKEAEARFKEAKKEKRNGECVRPSIVEINFDEARFYMTDEQRAYADHAYKTNDGSVIKTLLYCLVIMVLYFAVVLTMPSVLNAINNMLV